MTVSHAAVLFLPGDRLKEATKINLSLSALGNVISALVDSKSGAWHSSTCSAAQLLRFLCMKAACLDASNATVQSKQAVCELHQSCRNPAGCVLKAALMHASEHRQGCMDYSLQSRQLCLRHAFASAHPHTPPHTRDADNDRWLPMSALYNA